MCSLRELEPSLGLVDCRELERAKNRARSRGGVEGGPSELEVEGDLPEQEVEVNLPKLEVDMGGRMKSGTH